MLYTVVVHLHFWHNVFGIMFLCGPAPDICRNKRHTKNSQSTAELNSLLINNKYELYAVCMHALPIVVTGQVVSKSAVPSVRGAAASCGRREEARGRETSGPGHQTPPARLGLERIEISVQ